MKKDKAKFHNGEYVMVRHGLKDIDKETNEVSVGTIMQKLQGKVVKLTLDEPAQFSSGRNTWLYFYNSFVWKEEFFKKLSLKAIFKRMEE